MYLAAEIFHHGITKLGGSILSKLRSATGIHPELLATEKKLSGDSKRFASCVYPSGAEPFVKARLVLRKLMLLLMWSLPLMKCTSSSL